MRKRKPTSLFMVVTDAQAALDWAVKQYGGDRIRAINGLLQAALKLIETMPKGNEMASRIETAITESQEVMMTQGVRS